MATTFSVEVDWDHNGTWTDETSRARRVQVKTGFDRPNDAVAGVGRCVLTMDNGDQRFSPGYTSGALYGKLLPRRDVRIKASDGSSTWTLFRGFIETIRPVAGEWRGGECVIECVDAVAVLDRQRIGVTYANSKAVDEAVSDVVSAAYTPPATNYSDNSDVLEHYGRAWPAEETSCLRALREISEAVYGRFYIARDGTATYFSRADRQNSSLDAAIVIGDYWERIKHTRPANLIGYWRLNESSGTTAADSSENGHDGTVSGVTWGAEGIGDGDPAASFDGVNDYADVYSTGLRDAFNGAAGTLLLWFKVRGASVWSDGVIRGVVYFSVDANNQIGVYKWSDGILWWFYVANGVMELVGKTTTSTDWLCLAITWDKAADQVKAYFNGAQEGATQTGLGVWAGQIASTKAVLGALNTSPSNVWDGYLAHAALWDVALTADEIAMLSGV